MHNLTASVLVICGRDQREPEAEAFAAVSVSVGDDREAFDARDDMLSGNAVFGEGAIFPFVLLIQRVLPTRHCGVAVQRLQAHVARVGDGLGVGMEANARLLEHPEVVPADSGVYEADDRARLLVDDELRLQGVTLFLARVQALFLRGCSTGVSVASMSTISYVWSLVTRAFLPGSVTAPLLISVSSHQRILQ